MRMIWETRSRLNREVVQHKERREISQLRSSNWASNSRACSFRLLDSEKRLADGSWDRHVCRFRGAVYLDWGKNRQSFKIRYCGAREEAGDGSKMGDQSIFERDSEECDDNWKGDEECRHQEEDVFYRRGVKERRLEKLLLWGEWCGGFDWFANVFRGQSALIQRFPSKTSSASHARLSFA